MPRFWKDALSTRRAMQRSPHMEMLRELSDEEVRQLQGCFLEIIKDVIEVCEKYHICYMAAGGTALGSVRHKGFIPWDDDVDLLMPREDLNRFVEIFDEALSDRYEMTSPNSKYPLESMISAIYKKNTRKTSFMDFNTPFPKGIHIDIFAIESVPRNPAIRRIKGYCAMAIQFVAVSALFYHFRDPKKKEFFFQTPAGRFNYRLRMTVGFLSSWLPYTVWGNWFDRFVRCKKDTGLWAVPTDTGHYFGHIMPKDVYYPPVPGDFEDIQINLPHNPDAYLTNQYGDYMTIPPVEEREKHCSVDFSLDLAADRAKEQP